jgi:hypothetical protein
MNSQPPKAQADKLPSTLLLKLANQAGFDIEGDHVLPVAGSISIDTELFRFAALVEKATFEALDAQAEQPVAQELVTLESALEAIEHLEQHNGPGRAADAREMLVYAQPASKPEQEPTAERMAEMLDHISDALNMPREGWRIASCDVMVHQINDLARGSKKIFEELLQTKEKLRNLTASKPNTGKPEVVRWMVTTLAPEGKEPLEFLYDSIEQARFTQSHFTGSKLEALCRCDTSSKAEASSDAWWVAEIEKIFTAQIGTPITADMKRAANIALKVARGEVWDDEAEAWKAAPAQPQEPVARVIGFKGGYCAIHPLCNESELLPGMVLYSAPPAAQRNAIIEECAKLCEGLEKPYREYTSSSYIEAVDKCAPEAGRQCWCHHCNEAEYRMTKMILCPRCGNKRCPHANDHRNACTGSNDPGQPGSAYYFATAPTQERALAAWNRRVSQQVPAGWISVKERLPEVGATVLCAWDKSLATAIFSGRTYWHNPEDDEDDYAVPSYWMPLPQPPIPAAPSGVQTEDKG